VPTTLAPTTATPTLAIPVLTDFSIQIFCNGTKTSNKPLVMFESDMGGSLSDWVWIQQSLTAQGIYSCAYSRSGYGYSTNSGLDRTVDNIAAELNSLLASSALGFNLKNGVVFVAQGFGSYISRYYAARYGNVEALVLVDGINTNFQSSCSIYAPTLYDQTLLTLDVLCPTGISRAMFGVPSCSYQSPIISSFPTDTQPEVIAYYHNCNWYDTVMNEDANESYSCGLTKSLPKTSTPVVQIVSGMFYSNGGSSPRTSTDISNSGLVSTISTKGSTITVGGANQWSITGSETYAAYVTAQVVKVWESA